MMPYKENGHHTIEELFYNKKTQMGPLCIKNVFGILKITFKELFCKSKLNKY